MNQSFSLLLFLKVSTIYSIIKISILHSISNTQYSLEIRNTQGSELFKLWHYEAFTKVPGREPRVFVSGVTSHDVIKSTLYGTTVDTTLGPTQLGQHMHVLKPSSVGVQCYDPWWDDCQHVVSPLKRDLDSGSKRAHPPRELSRLFASGPRWPRCFTTFISEKKTKMLICWC